MSIELELETEIETEVESETTKKNRVEPFAMENRMSILLSKRNDPVEKGTKDLGRMMALFDPNGS